MFESFYQSFLAAVVDPTYTKTDERLLVSGRQLKAQLFHFFSLYTKSKSFLAKSLEAVQIFQTKYETNMAKFAKRLTKLSKKLKNGKRVTKSPAHRRRESNNANARGSGPKERDAKAQSFTKQPTQPKPVTERSKTPEFNTKAIERISNKQKSPAPASNGFPLTSSKKMEATNTVNDGKSVARAQPVYVNNSPVRNKLNSNTKAQKNKKLSVTKQSGGDGEHSFIRGKQDCSLTTSNKETKNTLQKESKSSLSNMGHRNSLYELKHKSTLEKITVVKTSSTNLDESSALRSSIIKYKKQLTIGKASLGSFRSKQVTVSYNGVLSDFMKKLESRGNAKYFDPDADDSDITDVNPLEL